MALYIKMKLIFYNRFFIALLIVIEIIIANWRKVKKKNRDFQRKGEYQEEIPECNHFVQTQIHVGKKILEMENQRWT